MEHSDVIMQVNAPMYGPKGVDPARAIQYLKRSLVFDYLKLRKKKKPGSVLNKPEGIERNPKIPFPPEYTVRQDGQE